MRRFAGVLAFLSIFLVSCVGSDVGIGNGASVIGSGECADTDDGNFPLVDGKVTASGGYERFDTCIGANMLIEQYCEDGKAMTQNYRCENVCDPVDHRCY